MPAPLLLDPGVAKSDAEVLMDPSDVETMSNQRVLLVVTLSFALFVCAEIIAAVTCHSLSLLGDAAAMSVDVFSYLTNMIAERIKARTNGVLDLRTRFILEVAVPTFSISCLLGVTAWVASDAIRILSRPSGSGGGDEEDLDVSVLYGFACANFLVDVVSFWMFYRRGRSVFMTSYEALPSALDGPPLGGASTHALLVSADGRSPSPSSSSSSSFSTSFYGQIKDGEEQASGSTRINTANLNMISAFSHVGGDTLRTASIFVAALVSTITGAAGYLVDAWAAAIVCLSIVFMVVPLVLEISRAYRRMQSKA